MRKIIIVYHAYLFGPHYMDMIIEQFRRINNHPHDLLKSCDKMYIGVVDSKTKKPPWGVEWINKTFKGISSSKNPEPNPKVEIVVYPGNRELRDTLTWIKNHAAKNPEDYILFFHTKGITHQNQAVTDWRRYMEYFVLDKWRDCIQKLDEGYDCCGVLWNKHTPIGEFPHFSGAFYWATAKYINTLNHDYIDSEWRYHMEFWIGSNLNAKVFEFHNSGYNTTERLESGQGHYHLPYPEKNYKK